MFYILFHYFTLQLPAALAGSLMPFISPLPLGKADSFRLNRAEQVARLRCLRAWLHRRWGLPSRTYLRGAPWVF